MKFKIVKKLNLKTQIYLIFLSNLFLFLSFSHFLCIFDANIFTKDNNTDLVLQPTDEGGAPPPTYLLTVTDKDLDGP